MSSLASINTFLMVRQPVSTGPFSVRSVASIAEVDK